MSQATEVMDFDPVSTDFNGQLTECVQQCGICHKPFVKESSFKRHVLYCRRTRHRPRPRAKACHACSLAKVKCNLKPQCQRCIDKGVECAYDSFAASRGVTKGSQLLDSSKIDSSLSSPSSEWSCPQISTEVSAQQELAMQADSNLFEFNLDEMIAQSPKNQLPFLPELGKRPQHTITDSYYGTERTDCHSNNTEVQVLSTNSLVWPMLNCYHPDNAQALALTRSLEGQVEGAQLSPIPKSDPISNFTAKMVMNALHAFPQMMLRRESLPPFIHGHWYNTPGSSQPALPAPLLSCMGLAQVFTSHNLETRSFLWRTIQCEQQAAMEKIDQGSLPKCSLLASIQAQVIYIMMRMADNSAAEQGYNLQLLVIFQQLCEKFKQLCNQPFFQAESCNPSVSWEDWIFAESRRRTAIVWLLITQMVHIKIGVPCDSFSEFRDIPLPAPRSLWEAKTLAEWQSEFGKYKTAPRPGLDTVGNLINASKQRDVTTNDLRLDVWNAGIDNLGLLLNLSVAIM